MRKNVAEYKGVYCIEYIPWVVFGVAAGISLFKYKYYTLWMLLFIGVVSLLKLVRCKYNSPTILATIYTDAVKINSEKKSEIIDISEVDYVSRRWNGVVIKKKNGEITRVRSINFTNSNEIESFVAIVNELVDKQWVRGN